MDNILGGYLLPHPPIIIEEIGKGEQVKAEDTIKGVQEVSKDIKNKNPGTIILITPHGPLFRDAIAVSAEEELEGDFGRFGYSNLEYRFKNNLKLVECILEKSEEKGISTVKLDKNASFRYNVSIGLDHGALVPLHFINKELDNFKLVHITYGMLEPRDLYKFGQIIKSSLEELGEEGVVIASGDLSHKLSEGGPYEYSPHGAEFDREIIKLLEENQLDKVVDFDLELAERAGECGLRSLMVMAGALEGYGLDTKVLSYEGPFGVGYGTAIVDLKSE